MTSAEQDFYVELAELQRNNALRLAMLPKLKPEEVAYLTPIIRDAMVLHQEALLFDDHLAMHRAKAQSTCDH